MNYYRDRVRRNRHIRRLTRARNHSSDPSHILFPPLALPASPKSSAFKTSNISRAKSLDSLSSKSSPLMVRNEDIKPVLGRNDGRKNIPGSCSSRSEGGERPLPAVPKGSVIGEQIQTISGKNSGALAGQRNESQNDAHRSRRTDGDHVNCSSSYETLGKYSNRKRQLSSHQGCNGPNEIKGNQRRHEVSTSSSQRRSFTDRHPPEKFGNSDVNMAGKMATNPNGQEERMAKTSPLGAMETREDINKRIRPPKVPERNPIFTCSTSQMIFSPPQHTTPYGLGPHDGVHNRNQGYTFRPNVNTIQSDPGRLGAPRKVHYTVNYMHTGCVPCHPQGVHIPHNFPQATTPFLSPKVSHEDLSAANSGQMTTWKSNSTLNTEQGYDTDTIYQCLKKIADSYGESV